MKTFQIIILALILSVSAAMAQDTIYVYKAGAVVYKSVLSEVDSVTFQKVYPPLTVTDIDGNLYHTMKIGTQIWMTENLKSTHYNNGDAIAYEPDKTNTVWAGLTTGAWCDYNNNAAIGVRYGHLYNWYAASDSRNIAPVGWHVPTDAEWTTLTTFLGGEANAGDLLKEAGTTDWVEQNAGATNITGFTALPGGYRDVTFINLEFGGYWWTTSEYNPDYGKFRYMAGSLHYVGKDKTSKKLGFSIRCVKD